MLRQTVCSLLTIATLVPIAGAVETSGKTRTYKGVDEIVVTAQKREENLQDVPISITAITETQIESLGAQEMDEIALPNFYLTETTSSTLSQVSIRGIFQNRFYSNIEQAYGVYIDGVYVGNPASVINMDTGDIARIELLRGPQGTLFGKNTTSGALNVTTKAPGNEFGGHVEAQLGYLDLRRIRGSVDVPIAEDVLSARISVHRAKRDGYVDYVGNTPCSDCGANIDMTSGRFQLSFTPNEKFTLRTSVSYFDDDHVSYSYDPVGPPPLADFIPFTSQSDIGTEKRENLAMALMAEYRFDNGYTLTSVTGWRDDLAEVSFDLDESSLDLVYTTFGNDAETWSQELRIASPTDNWYDFVAGIYWYDFSTEEKQELPVLFGSDLTQIDNYDVTSLAMFGQINFHLSDRLTAFVGARYTDESKEAVRRQTGGFATVPFRQADIDSEEPSWTLGARYQWTDDSMAYGTVSRGFKSGGFDLGNSGNNTVVDAEYVTSYEIGAKSSWWEDRMRLNAALFYMVYEDFQAQTRIFDATAPGGTRIVWLNAAELESKGVEIDLAAQLTNQLSLTMGIGYVRALYDDFPGVAGLPLTGGVLPNAAGNEAEMAPEWTFNAGLGHELPLSNGGHWVTRLDYHFVDNRYANADGGVNNVARRLLGYGMFNAHIGYESPGEVWSLKLWGKNLTDKLASTTTYEGFLLGTAVNRVGARYLEPRTWGVTARYNF